MKERFPIARVLGFDFVHRCQGFPNSLYFEMKEMKNCRQLIKRKKNYLLVSYLMRPIAA